MIISDCIWNAFQIHLKVTSNCINGRVDVVEFTPIRLFFDHSSKRFTPTKRPKEVHDNSKSYYAFNRLRKTFSYGFIRNEILNKTLRKCDELNRRIFSKLIQNEILKRPIRKYDELNRRMFFYDDSKQNTKKRQNQKYDERNRSIISRFTGSSNRNVE